MNLIRTTIVLGLLMASVAAGAETGPKRFVYKKVGEKELAIYLYSPADLKEGEKRPGIVFFHGGGWVSGTADKFDEQAKYFASRGMVCLSAEYRLLGKGEKQTPQVCIEDAKSAMRWARAHAAEFGMDPDRIASSGGSAGGHLAAAVSMLEGFDDPQDDLKVSPKSNAMILFCPVFNNGPGQYGYGRVGERYKEFSPAHHVTNQTPPAVVMLGDKDHLIPVDVVKKFGEEMKAAGVKCDVHIYPGMGHGFHNFKKGENRGYLDSMRDAEAFLVELGWLSKKG